ncbi:hypothetical protein PN36_29575 [Candidatus Thiomargarita nelsonii]|uniref:Endonuclease GajA/Old nuclease/RecF-like AAA domain-containing protein n=1 Tax=Candidatus Thiomargarita nelsonii TaxID=1003181 RepID=A0A0A6RVY8_9GAMM|nr:hypothetical protein PN36_29575 [Candidatus Thiomargarita nelsonii]
MQLIIQNFGPIKQGEIDLTKKFYVFVGYNNTGKTYVSQLLWSIFNEKTLKNFSEQVNPDVNLSQLEEKQFRYHADPIFGEFARFLKHQVMPKIFNIDKHHFILEKFSVHFKYDIKLIKKLFNTHHHQPIFLPASRLFYPLFYSYVYRVQKEKYENA